MHVAPEQGAGFRYLQADGVKQAEQNLPEEPEAFMINISGYANLTQLPPRDRIELYSVAPRNLRVLPRR